MGLGAFTNLALLVVGSFPRGKFVVDDTIRGRMPKVFGGWSPEDDAKAGNPRPCPTCMGTNGTYPDNTFLGLTFTSEVAALLPFVPEGLELIAPNVSISFTQARNVTWIGGRTYHMFGLSVPVRHAAASGSVIEAPFDFVLFENMTECILAGREYSGVAKIHAEIDWTKTIADGGGDAAEHNLVQASWDGLAFLEMSVVSSGYAVSTHSQLSLNNFITARYFPRPGHPGAEVAEYGNFPSTTLSVNSAPALCSFEWLPGRANKTANHTELPTLRRFVNPLAALPVIGAPFNCYSATGAFNMRNDLSSRLGPIDQHESHGSWRATGPWPGAFAPSKLQTYAMPIEFGAEARPARVVYPDNEAFTVRVATDGTALLTHLPTSLQLLEPYLILTFSRATGLEWLGGRATNSVEVAVRARHTASGVEGDFILVVLQDRADTVIAGREAYGSPNIIATLNFTKSSGTREANTTEIRVDAAWEGLAFLRLAARPSSPLAPPPKPTSYRRTSLQFRFLPALGRTNREVSEIVSYPTDITPTSSAPGVNCFIEWPTRGRKLTIQDHPTQFRTINALAALPILDTPTCTFTHSKQVHRNDLVTVIATI